MIKRNVVLLGAILCLILFVPVIAYIVNFSNHQVSFDSSDWGTFGDYIGGIANPIIGIANVLVLYYLTVRIAETENENKNKEQANRINRNLDEIRFIGFKELNCFYIRLVKRMANNTSAEDGEGVALKFEFHGIIHPYIDLFETFNDLGRINR